MEEQFLMSTFKGLCVGAKLTVRDDLKEDLEVPFDVSEDMERYAGQEVTVVYVEHSGKLRIKEDGQEFMWPPPMFIDPSQVQKIPLSQYLI